ncbi:MAG: hypothetical protein O2898_05415 [Proteobacteria bacterium]|nr:hypothetical protein [Pseudomonadota bacterium]
MDDRDEVLARIGVSQPRRWLGVAMLYGLGALLLYVAFSTPPEPGWLVFLVVAGLGSLWMGEAMRRGTDGALVLTEAGLFDSDGSLLATFDDIRKVERGFLAFKPSNGFVVTTTTPGQRRWRPGLYWRVGRRIGVGGVTAASQTRMVADLMSARLMMRDNGHGS